MRARLAVWAAAAALGLAAAPAAACERLADRLEYCGDEFGFHDGSMAMLFPHSVRIYDLRHGLSYRHAMGALFVLPGAPASAEAAEAMVLQAAADRMSPQTPEIRDLVREDAELDGAPAFTIRYLLMEPNGLTAYIVTIAPLDDGAVQAMTFARAAEVSEALRTRHADFLAQMRILR